MQTPQIEPNQKGRDGRTGMLVKWPFDEDFNALVKTRFPRDDRYFNGVSAWWIASQHADELKALLLARFGGLLLLAAGDGDDTLIDRSGVAVTQGRLL